ncbi:hypothetical protein [Glutamicibacter sp. NPDC087344]|uniref:hypothetical protein n=1 Tax=Glutamicibacter sp. NPDC087344 TaxID=3363994 RepID=UPI003823C5D6
MGWRVIDKCYNQQSQDSEETVLAVTAIGIHAMELLSKTESAEARNAIQKIAMNGIAKIGAQRKPKR